MLMGSDAAHIRQSKPGSGLRFQVQFLEIFGGAPSSFGSGALSPTPRGQEYTQRATEEFRETPMRA